MDLRFTDDEYAFQGEARQFFRTAVPAAIRDKLNAGHGLTATEIRAWFRTGRSNGVAAAGVLCNATSSKPRWRKRLRRPPSPMACRWLGR